MFNLQLPDVYSKKALVWGLFGIATLCLASMFTDGAGFALILPLILIGFGKNRTLLLTWCLLATTILTMTNDFFVPKSSTFFTVGKVVYLLVGGVMTLQIIGQHRSKVITPLLFLLVYLVYAAVISAVGWMPLVSYLKLTLFTVTFLAFYSVATATATRLTVRPEVLRSILLSFACFLLVGSLLLIPFPSISHLRVEQFFLQYGYIPEGTLFMGIANQSQALGPIVAIFATMLLADWLFSVKKWSWLYALLFACTPILIYKTGSRTAMGTYLAGLLFVGFFFMRVKGLDSKWKSRALSVGFLVGTLGILSLFATPAARQSVREFVFKWEREGVETDASSWDKLTSSRQGLVERMKENIAESPAIGNGFQVSKEMEHLEVSDFNQLLGQPIEKGVWIYAVTEEGGFFGMVLFCLFLIVAFTLLLSRQAYIGAALLFVFTISNFGEFTFFSMSGMGGIFWAMLFVGLALDAQRIRRQERERVMALLNHGTHGRHGSNVGSGYGPVGGSYGPVAGNYGPVNHGRV